MQNFRRYAEIYEDFNKKKPYQKEIEFVYNWAEKPKTIIDIGCGTANYWDYFPSFLVQGLERSKDMIRQSKHSQSIVHGDAMKFPLFPRRFDCATALFDVINYIPIHDWWYRIPVRIGGYFVFDVFDYVKSRAEGFRKTVRRAGGWTRTITPLTAGKVIILTLEFKKKEESFNEEHIIFMHSHQDILKYCGSCYEIIETKKTDTWQKWYKLKRVR